MKILLCILISFSIANSSYTQQKNDTIIKKIVEFEILTIFYTNGKRAVITKKIIETEYNSYGKKTLRITKTFHNSKPYKTKRKIYVYNKENKIDFEKNFIEEDSIYYKTYYNYDIDNVLKIYAEYIINDKQCKYQQYYRYNANGKTISSTYSFIEEDIESSNKLRDLKAEFIYDKNERLIESNWLQSDDSYLNNLIIHIRNKKGLIIKEKRYNLNNDLVKETKFKYEFDIKKNWIIKKTYENNILTKTTYREIEYFN